MQAIGQLDFFEHIGIFPTVTLEVLATLEREFSRQIALDDLVFLDELRVHAFLPRGGGICSHFCRRFQCLHRSRSSLLTRWTGVDVYTVNVSQRRSLSMSHPARSALPRAALLCFLIRRNSTRLHACRQCGRARRHRDHDLQFRAARRDSARALPSRPGNADARRQGIPGYAVVRHERPVTLIAGRSDGAICRRCRSHRSHYRAIHLADRPEATRVFSSRTSSSIS